MSYDLLSRTFLITDVDGTLLDDNGKISEKNLFAIDELKRSGGRFTIATGRGSQTVMPVLEMLKLKEKAIIFNGAAVCDFSEVPEKYIWQSVLPEESDFYLRNIMREFPTTAIVVLRYNDVYVPRSNELEARHLSYGKINPIFCRYDEVPLEGRIKVLLVDEPQNINEIIKFIDKNKFDKTSWVRSSEYYYEILPPGVNKGAGIKRLLDSENNLSNNNKINYIVTVGDYMNDIEMLRMADLGVAVGNTLEKVKTFADLITADNNHDAVHEIVKYIKDL